MSQSTDATESNSFTSPRFLIAGALVLMLIAAAVVIFLLPSNRENAEPAAAPTQSSGPTATAPNPSAGKESESVCGLPGSNDTGLGAAPESEWELVGTMAAPSAPATGPGKIAADGFRSCFAHSPTGALYAAANILASTFNGYAEQVYTELSADGPARDRAVEAIEAGQDVGGGTAPRVQIAGFIMHSYTSEAAVVELALRAEDGGYGAISTSLLWEDGDWKLDMPAAGGGEVRQLSDLSSFIPWAGV